MMRSWPPIAASKALPLVERHRADLFANKRAKRMKVLVHDGIAARRAAAQCIV